MTSTKPRSQMPKEQSSMQKEQYVTSEPLKNYYDILGVNRDATLTQIENAYQKLALKWHPDKHTSDRRLAERKFQQISQAFDVLSDINRRSTYDRMITQKSSLENAYKIFDRFFGQNEMVSEQQEKFFEQHFPDRRKNYYKILGVNKDATMDEITNAYRKLVLKYHPKTNPNNQEAQRKFVEINQAFQTLSNRANRSTYDDLIFNEMIPRRSFDIFENFFEDRWRDIPSEVDFFKPIFSRRRPWLGMSGWGDMNQPMLGMRSELGTIPRKELENIKQGQSFYKQQKFEKKNGKQNRSVQTIKRKIKNGEVEEQILKENVLPNGEKDVMKTLKRGDKVVDSKTYHLKRDENLPKQLTNF